MYFKKAFDYINKDLQFIFLKAKHIEEINKYVISLLERDMQSYCKVGNISKNILTLFIANASIATRLRYNQFELLRKCKQDKLLSKIEKINFKVNPFLFELNMEKSAAKTKPQMSDENALLIEEMARTLKDEQLKKVMLKIANRN